MTDLLAHPDKVKRIADNSVKTFRERYLTPAAEACYWRQLVRAYAEVAFVPRRDEGRGVRWETFV
jgi:hypothetical protein